MTTVDYNAFTRQLMEDIRAIRDIVAAINQAKTRMRET